MASQRTTRATARVIAAGSTGSGFIVSLADRLLLTARHCVEDAAGAVCAQVDLELYDPSSERAAPRFATARAHVVEHGVAGDDWALLQLDDGETLPAWSTELPLLLLEPGADHLWSTYGFPGPGATDDWRRGEPLGGTFRQGGALPQILDQHVRGAQIAGASGGPLVVEEHAVGLIIRADRTAAGVATTGRLYALPFARCDAALWKRLGIRPEPAFLARTTTEVGKGKGLPDVARAVWSLESYDPIEGISNLQRLIALWLLLFELPGALRVAEEAELPEPEAHAVVGFAACQWFPRTCAGALAKRLLGISAPRAISVEADNVDLLRRFVKRAGFEHGRSIAWDHGYLGVTWTPGQSADELADDVAVQILHLLTGDGASVTAAQAALAAWARTPPALRTPPCIWVALPDATRDTDILHLCNTYPQLGIIVCGPPRPAAPALAAGALDPAESRARAAEFDQAKRYLANLHRRVNRV